MWPLNKSKPIAKRGAEQALSLKRRRRIRIFMRSLSLVVVCAGIIASVYIWKSGLFQQWMLEAHDTVDRRIVEAGFMVREVRITGQENTELKAVRTALGLYDGQSIVSLDLEIMLGRIEALPWVKAATIVKLMPDVLEVVIAEHEAVALWQENGRLYLVDGAGEIITGKGVEKFAGIPHVVGVQANENLTSLLGMKNKYPDLFAKVKSSVWIGKRRWDLNLTGGIIIKLPEKGPDLAWDRLYEYQSRQKILTKDVLIIDFRQHGKTIVRLTPQEAERRRQLNKSGKKEESI